MSDRDATAATPSQRRWRWLFAVFCLCWAFFMLGTVEWDLAEHAGSLPVILLIQQFQESVVGMCLGVGALLASIALLALLMLRGWTPTACAIAASLVIGLVYGAGTSALTNYPGSAIELVPPSDWFMASIVANVWLVALAIPVALGIGWRDRKRRASPRAS